MSIYQTPTTTEYREAAASIQAALEQGETTVTVLGQRLQGRQTMDMARRALASMGEEQDA